MDNIIKKERKKRQKRNYFDNNTDDAIILYNRTEDPKLKNKIYEQGIHYSFFKLTQNIIHTFKFYNTEVENLEHLQHEIIIFLLSKIHLYDRKRNIQEKLEKIIRVEFEENYEGDFESYIGDTDEVTTTQIKEFVLKLDISDKCREKAMKIPVPKGFSYFGTITKRWLINYTRKNYNKLINNVLIDQLNSYSNNDSNSNSNISILDRGIVEITETPKSMDLSEVDRDNPLSYFINDYVSYCDRKLEELFPKPIDAKIADCILELFRRREEIVFFNKKALYANVREVIDVKTPKITKISKKLHKIFKSRYNVFINEDQLPR